MMSIINEYVGIKVSFKDGANYSPTRNAISQLFKDSTIPFNEKGTRILKRDKYKQVITSLRSLTKDIGEEDGDLKVSITPVNLEPPSFLDQDEYKELESKVEQQIHKAISGFAEGSEDKFDALLKEFMSKIEPGASKVFRGSMLENMIRACEIYGKEEIREVLGQADVDILRASIKARNLLHGKLLEAMGR